MKERLEKQLNESQENLNAVFARITNYDSQISKINEERNKEVQEALRLDGEIRLLNKLLKEEK